MNERAKTRLAHYRSKLIDLSLRNKLLNYRPGRSSSVPVVDEVPRVVTARLIEDQASFGFLPRAEDGPVAGGEEYHRLEDAELAPRHTDRMLQTTLAEEDLGRTLKNLYLKSRTSFEEQGVVTLFLAIGMLEWYEPGADGQAHLAPILLVPVELSREGVGRPFTLRAHDLDPDVNPSLLRKLAVDFAVQPELPATDEEVDPDAVFEALAACRPDPRWRVLTDMHLSLFSFSKYIMYKDLEDQADVLLENPLVARLAGEAVAAEADPEPPDPADLDSLRDPEEVHQILDADSSQQVAIETVRRGSDLVLEGPPGTGKSQTIANLIAESLADGRTVLFASEKMAALEVVKRRLDGAGLGDYVLELHSRHTNKRDVVNELKRCLERERVAAPPDASELDRLARTREELTEYVQALHGPFGTGGLSPWDALGTLAARDAARDVLAGIDRPEDVPEAERIRRTNVLADLARAREAVEPRAGHPFRISRRTDVPRALAIELERDLGTLAERAGALTGIATEEAAALGLPVPADLPAADRLVALLAHLAASPRPDPARLEDPGWPGYSAEGRGLAAKGRRYREGRMSLAKHWTVGLYDAALGDLAARRKRHGTGVGRFFRLSWWRDGKTLKAFRRPGARRSAAEEIEDLELAVGVRDLGAEIDRTGDRAEGAFGRFFAGRDTDFEKLDALCVWGGALRDLLPGEAAPPETARAAADPAGLADRAARLRAALESAREAATAVRDHLAAREDPPEGLPELEEFARTAGERLEEIHPWCAYRRTLAEAREAGLASFLEAAEAEGLDGEELVPAWEKAFAGAFLDRVRADRPRLRDFDGNRHEAAIARFAELDRAQLTLAAGRIRARLDADLPASRSFSPDSDVGLLLREAAKKRRHLPLRRLLNRAGTAIRKLKPCFMMSPLSIAQYLPPDSEPFDLVVFDEASQICPEDAVGALARGRHAVVVGDSRQLPPTSFFAYDPDVEVEEEDGEEAPPDLESILDLCATQGFPRLRLKWHYRSRDESLIAFSNRHFYDDSLFTFPSPGGIEGLGIELVHVPDGVYDRGRTRTNAVEAARVAEGIAEQLRVHPDLTVGVVTFSEAQRRAVLEEVERLAHDDPALEAALTARDDEPFFVKNLENVQGDERDVMFFSVGYGPDESGKLTMNFGPLNGEGGHRRLNVAVTRARSGVRVYSSIRPEEIDPERAKGRGARLLRSYLEYADRGRGGGSAAESGEAPASPLESALASALTDRGFCVAARIGHSSRRLDLALGEPDAPDRFVLGVECDGPGYRDTPTARDRDRLRSQVLARLGWRLAKVWAPDFVRSPHRVVDRLKELAGDGDPEETTEPEAPPPPPPAPPDPAPVETAEPEDLPEVAPWRPTPKSKRRPRREFSEESTELPKLVVAVVTGEGPVHVDEVTRRLADSYDTRLTKKVRDAFERAIDGAASAGDVSRRGDFLWPPDLDEAPIRGAAADGTTRAVEHVPPEEIAGAVRMVLEIDLRLPREALLTAVARVLGYRRRTDGVTERLTEVLDGELERKSVVEEEGYVSAAP